MGMGFGAARSGRPWVARLTCSCLVLLTLVGCGETKPPAVKAPVVVAPPQPPLAPPEVEAIAEVTVKPGALTKVPITIDRKGHLGIIEIGVDNPPEGITVEGGTIPAGTSRGELVVKAAETLGDNDLSVDIPLTGMVNGIPIQASFKLSVPQYEMPVFSVADTTILVQGRTSDVALDCDRKGFPGPIGLTIGDATAASPVQPEGVACSVESLEKGEASTTLRIVVADDVEDGWARIPLTAQVRDRTTTTELSLKITRYPVRVGLLPAVVMTPGESRTLTLPIERNGYDGPVAVEAVNVPSGLEFARVEVPAEAGAIDTDLRCRSDAAEKVETLTLRASTGDLTIDTPLVIRVSSGDGQALPDQVLNAPRSAALLRKGSFGGRMTRESKQALRDLYGGTALSDAAVMRGLAWLARVQQADGGWTLAGMNEGGDAAASQPVAENRIAATALALLPFLSEGITHKSAPEEPRTLVGYQPVVERGLVFLARNQGQGQDRGAGSWNAGMQAQALATITFCEAYAISRDRKARVNAQQAVKFLIESQDPSSGGWRNAADEPPDLTVTAWAILALRAAQLANLSVKAKHLDDAERFLRLCAVGQGDNHESLYAAGPGREAEPGLTAAALLARLYLGWERDRPELVAGKDYLIRHLPPLEAAPLGDLFFFHCATRVLQQLEGVEFDTWNALVRDHLLRSQTRAGDLAGSWDPEGMKDGGRGGRMYATALALLTLQTYYRHLPMDLEVPKQSDDSAAAEETEAEDPD